MVVKQAKTKGKRWQGKEARGVLALPNQSPIGLAGHTKVQQLKQ